MVVAGWERIQNSDQTGNGVWGRNVGCNETTRKTDCGELSENATMGVRSDTQRQDQERTHPRNNEIGTGFQKDHREKTELRAGEETYMLIWRMTMCSHIGDPT